MNAPTLITGAAVAAGTATIIAVQEITAAAGAGRSTADIIQIIGVVSTAIIAVATVVGGIVVQIISARMKVAVAAAIAPVVSAVADVDVKADAIKHSVDGAATKMRTDLAAAITIIEQLRADKVDQKEIIIAQAKSGAAPAVAGSAAEDHLEQIETNTDATAKNTAKTDATVQQLKDQP